MINKYKEVNKMSENIIKTNEKIENGKLNVAGINIDISKILGDKIIDEYIATLPEDDMQTIIKYISSDLFEERNKYNGDCKVVGTMNVIKERTKDYYGHYNEKEIPLGELIKNHFNERVKEELVKKIDEIIATTDYKNKIEEIANELIEYATNGYKEDMKNRIRERLCGNVMDVLPQYAGVNITTIVNDILNQRLY